jgi:hypothetical protein
MELLIVYALLTSSAFYLGSRAVITSWLWGRYPKRLARFMDCAACSGAWYGAGFSYLANVLGYPSSGPLAEWWSPILVGLCSIVWTPIVAGLMQAGFERLGTVVDDD